MILFTSNAYLLNVNDTIVEYRMTLCLFYNVKTEDALHSNIRMNELFYHTFFLLAITNQNT